MIDMNAEVDMQELEFNAKQLKAPKGIQVLKPGMKVRLKDMPDLTALEPLLKQNGLLQEQDRPAWEILVQTHALLQQLYPPTNAKSVKSWLDLLTKFVSQARLFGLYPMTRKRNKVETQEEELDL